MLTSELWIVWVGAKVATNTIWIWMGKGAVLTLELGQAKCCKIFGDPETTDSKIKDVWF